MQMLQFSHIHRTHSHYILSCQTLIHDFCVQLFGPMFYARQDFCCFVSLSQWRQRSFSINSLIVEGKKEGKLVRLFVFNTLTHTRKARSASFTLQWFGSLWAAAIGIQHFLKTESFFRSWSRYFCYAHCYSCSMCSISFQHRGKEQQQMPRGIFIPPVHCCLTAGFFGQFKNIFRCCFVSVFWIGATLLSSYHPFRT